MNCPACSGNLRKVKMQLITADLCSQCQGIWFEKNMLKWAANQIAVKSDIQPNELQSLFEKRDVLIARKIKTIRTCPKCQLAMKIVNYAYDSNIFIDRCSECKGIWTDKGELKAIARFIKRDPRIEEIGKALTGKSTAMEEMDSFGEYGKILLFTYPSFYGILAALALGTVKFIMDRINDHK